jgi:hypothetical protein
MTPSRSVRGPLLGPLCSASSPPWRSTTTGTRGYVGLQTLEFAE